MGESPTGYERTEAMHGQYPSDRIEFLTCRAPAWRGVPVKKAAAEASMQRSKKARMVELFVVRYHVMCPFLRLRFFPVSGFGPVVRQCCQKRRTYRPVRYE